VWEGLYKTWVAIAVELSSDRVLGSNGMTVHKDELLHHIMIYWSLNRLAPHPVLRLLKCKCDDVDAWMKEGIKNWVGSWKVPAAFALFRKISVVSAAGMGRAIFQRATLDRNVRGGHFAAVEERSNSLRYSAWFRPFATSPSKVV